MTTNLYRYRYLKKTKCTWYMTNRCPVPCTCLRRGSELSVRIRIRQTMRIRIRQNDADPDPAKRCGSGPGKTMPMTMVYLLLWSSAYRLASMTSRSSRLRLVSRSTLYASCTSYIKPQVLNIELRK
jgi:hypothetical protein